MFVQLLIFLLLAGGSFFFLVGTIGLIRLPDAFSRMHATTKCDTLGAGLILMGLILHQGLHMISLKLLVIMAFIMLTNPTAAHIIAKAAYYSQNLSSKVKSLPKE
ncbi:MAG: monovalent cation/H(+) antiporter subunit G [Bacillota bacterium]|nr:monovalent cation/H(+) antiporter subunit G [Bacillota bacterium]MDW7677760.1 monovalent cation/H(+) antiporter subunit G [Bacillota bacterium]